MNRSTKLPFCPLGTAAGPRPARRRPRVRRRVQAGRRRLRSRSARPAASVL